MGRFATVRAAALDATWETVGSDRAAGLWVEGLSLEADGWGPSKASFSLRRQPGMPWPDLGAFSPIDVDVDNVPVWSGRVTGTPSAGGLDRSMSVQCEGWQYHLDDDPINHGYVHTDLTAWKDQRSFPTAVLTSFRAVGQVSNDSGAITLMWPQGVVIPANTWTGVVLDLGPGNAARRVSIDWDSSNNAVGVSLIVRGTDNGDPTTGTVEDAISFAQGGGTTGANSGSFANNPHRYIHLIMFYAAGNAGPGADLWFRLRGVRVYTDATYESFGGTSVLLASTVVLDGLARGAVLLSPDRSGVQATSTFIPTFWPTEPKTVRQLWEGADAYHGYRKQVDVYRRAIYAPLPAAATVEVGSWTGGADDRPQENSGANIYNGALLVGQTPDGTPIVEQRATQGGDYAYAAAAQLSNPSFDVNTTGWTALNGSIARDTGVFDTGPASLRLSTAAGAIALASTASSASWATPLEEGRGYRLRMRLRRAAFSDLDGVFELHDGVGGFYITAQTIPVAFLTADTFVTYVSPVFTAKAGALTPFPHVWFRCSTIGTNVLGYVDGVEVLVARPTIIDRRGFKRRQVLQAQNALPPDMVAADVLADAWLGAHKTTPFKGSRALTGTGACRDLLTGAGIPPERLLLKTTELMRMSDQVDDAGALGRDARIVNVAYELATDTATVSLDSTDTNFENFMARVDLFAGQT